VLSVIQNVLFKRYIIQEYFILICDSVVFNNNKIIDTMENRVIKSRKRHSGIQGPMLKKVLKTMPHSKENIPELPLNYNSMFTNSLKKCLGLYFCITL